MLSMTNNPKVLRTTAQLLKDLDLAGAEYPNNPELLDAAQEETLRLEWTSTKSKTGESFSAFLKRRLSL